jgi:hypothetical protein
MRWRRHGASPGDKNIPTSMVLSVRNVILSRVRHIRNIILKYSLVKWDIRRMISFKWRGIWSAGRDL